jgi:hypothetical protein
MLIREIPALPFALDVQSASQWLDRLPVGNIRESCRLLFPVVQALNVHPMEPRLHFGILEQFNPVLFGAVRSLQPCFVDKPFPLDGKARKIASLAVRFHSEAARGYRQLVETEAFADDFDERERILILQRALEHVAHGQLRAAQIFEAPSSSAAKTLKILYRYAATGGLLDESVAAEQDPSPTVRELFERILLFRLAAPGRLAQTDMQRLFDRVWLRAGADVAGQGAGDGRRRAVFGYDPVDMGLLVPAWPDAPPMPGLAFLSVERLLPAFSEARTHKQSEQFPIERALSRIGEPLPCPDQAGKLRVMLKTGFTSVVSMFWDAEARRSTTPSAGSWSGFYDLSLTALGDLARPEAGLPRLAVHLSLAKAVASDETAEDLRIVAIVPAELPGFYLIDSGRWMFRAGLLTALNSDDGSVRLGVVRGGQFRDGRFWHSFELIGGSAKPVMVSGENAREGKRSGLFLYDETVQEPSLIVAPGKWRRDDVIYMHLSEERQAFRIAKVVEASSDFCQFALAEHKPATAIA